MMHKDTLKFLNDLKKNNNREWFQENKAIYDEVKKGFVEFLNQLIVEIGKFDKSIIGVEGKKSVFRINRDIRFSKDKSPYKVNMGAHIMEGGRKNEMGRAGYYIHLEPGNCFLAGGAYMPPSPWLKVIRSEIAGNADELRRIINDKDFKKYFGEMRGESLKTAPRDYPKDHPEIELLKRKSFLAVHEMPDDAILNKDFLKHSATVFKALYPFDRFLNSASIN